MNTIVKKIEEDNGENEVYEQAGEILKSGGLVAFPTETVYGLGGDALNPDASGRIYAAKGRPSDNPLIVHISDVSAMKELCVDIPKSAYRLADKFWPGPMTLILKKSSIVPKETTGGLDTVAIRMPNHPVALSLIRKSGVYIAAPSANTSGKPSPTLAEHVVHDLEGKIDMIIDGGEVGIGIESTIIDLTGKEPVILRPGYITPAMVKDIVGDIGFDKAILSENKDKGFVPKAPGMKYKHYAPAGELMIVEGDIEDVVDKINGMVKNKCNAGAKCGVLATTQTCNLYECEFVRAVGDRDDEITISRGLYKTLREFDELDIKYIFAESFAGDEFGTSIMNRLLKAAGYNIISV